MGNTRGGKKKNTGSLSRNDWSTEVIQAEREVQRERAGAGAKAVRMVVKSKVAAVFLGFLAFNTKWLRIK